MHDAEVSASLFHEANDIVVLVGISLCRWPKTALVGHLGCQVYGIAVANLATMAATFFNVIIRPFVWYGTGPIVRLAVRQCVTR